MHGFPPQVGFANAVAVLEQASQATSAGQGERVYDLSACTRFDSSLLAVLLELTRRAAAAGATCRFEGADANLLKLAQLYGVGVLLFGRPVPAGSKPHAGAAA